MKYIPGQHWQDKIAAINRLAQNFRPKEEARRFVCSELTDAERAHVESVTRFEMVRGRIVKQNWRQRVATNV